MMMSHISSIHWVVWSRRNNFCHTIPCHGWFMALFQPHYSDSRHFCPVKTFGTCHSWSKVHACTKSMYQTWCSIHLSNKDTRIRLSTINSYQDTHVWWIVVYTINCYHLSIISLVIRRIVEWGVLPSRNSPASSSASDMVACGSPCEQVDMLKLDFYHSGEFN